MFSGKPIRRASYDALELAMKRIADRTEYLKTVGQPEPGIFKASWPIPNCKIVERYTARPSPVLGLPFEEFYLEMAPGRFVTFKRFTMPVAGHDS